MITARALVLVALLAQAAHADELDTWTTNDSGQTFRTGFDLGSRVVLGTFYDGDWSVDGGMLIRERDDEGVQWKLDHALVSGRVGTSGAVDAVLYRGHFLRWSKDGALLIPTSPPTRLVLPFSLGFDVVVGHVRHDESGTQVGVAADLLFDFWRSYDFGSVLTLRTGVAYDLAIDPASRLTHVITPFSRVGLDFVHTWDSGREVFELHASLSHREHVTSDERWATDAEAALAYELVVIAINDAPVSLRLEGRWQHTSEDILSAGLGVRLGIPAR